MSIPGVQMLQVCPVTPNYLSVQMPLLITKVMSVEYQVTESELLRWFEEPTSCYFPSPQISVWHWQLLEGPVPTVGQKWSLPEGGGYCKGSVGAGRLWREQWDSKCQGQACEGPEWDGWLSSELSPWQKGTWIINMMERHLLRPAPVHKGGGREPESSLNYFSPGSWI